MESYDYFRSVAENLAFDVCVLTYPMLQQGGQWRLFGDVGWSLR